MASAQTAPRRLSEASDLPAPLDREGVSGARRQFNRSLLARMEKKFNWCLVAPNVAVAFLLGPKALLGTALSRSSASFL
jgi:hypothetical protein